MNGWQTKKPHDSCYYNRNMSLSQKHAHKCLTSLIHPYLYIYIAFIVFRVYHIVRCIPGLGDHWWWQRSWWSHWKHWELSSHSTLWSAAPASCWLPPVCAPEGEVTQWQVANERWQMKPFMKLFSSGSWLLLGFLFPFYIVSINVFARPKNVLSTVSKLMLTVKVSATLRGAGHFVSNW